MKKIICYLLMMMLLVSCGPQERPLVPIVVTVEVTMVTTTTASCECEVTADNDFSVIARGVCWSTSENPTIEDSTTSNGSGLGSYTAHLTGLSPNTTYYVRAYATNSEGTGYGEQKTFSTNAQLFLPTVTTGNISDITTTTANCTGNVTADGGASVTGRGICWSTSENPTIEDSTTSNGSGLGSYTAHLTGLSPNTTYYVRAYATNSEGTGYGEQKTFSTNAQLFLPTVTTGNVSDITTTTASCTGNVTADGGASVTGRGICWSTSENPTIEDSTTSNGSGLGSYTAHLTGLSLNTTYYVRAYATNIVGTTYGAQVTFTTRAAKATLSTVQFSNITSFSAVTGGNITNNGGSNITARGVCWSKSPQPTASLATRTQDGTGSGSFTSTMDNLASRSTYYVRAYATNAAGTAYGQEITLQTPASCTLSKSNLTVMPEGGLNSTIIITAFLSWTAEIIGSCNWLTLNTVTGSAGESQLSFTLQPNTTSKDRNITIKISCQDMHLDLLITQLRAGGYIDDGNLL